MAFVREVPVKALYLDEWELFVVLKSLQKMSEATDSDLGDIPKGAWALLSDVEGEI